jgi:Phage integrase family
VVICLKGFAKELSQGRYQWVAARKHIRSAEHFLHWIAHRNLSITNVEERYAQQFLDHLKRCRCRGHHPPLKPHRQKYSVDLWFVYLRRAGIVPTPIFVEPAVDTPMLVSFCDWMRRQRGASDATLSIYGFELRAFLKKLGGEPRMYDGKGRRERCIPLWKETASAVRAWLSVRGDVLAPELFLNARDGCMTRAGFEYILRKHVRTAEKRCASLSSKRVSPHVLRHTCAMTILQATKDLRKVSLWLGHSSVQTTEVYTRADPTVKLETLEAAIAPKSRTGRFKATDQLIALLKAPTIMRSKGAIP